MVNAPENGEMLSVPEVHALLKEERELRGELSYEQKLSAEHADLLDRAEDRRTRTSIIHSAFLDHD
jgi:DNA-directed RNA polymerase subunit F